VQINAERPQRASEMRSIDLFSEGIVDGHNQPPPFLATGRVA
jgi:hypothetical protein